MARRGFITINRLEANGTTFRCHCTVQVMRDGVTSPQNPNVDMDQFDYTVTVASADSNAQLKKLVQDGAVTAAATTSLTLAECVTPDSFSQLVLTGTGSAPSATGLPDGTIYLQYTP